MTNREKYEDRRRYCAHRHFSYDWLMQGETREIINDSDMMRQIRESEEELESDGGRPADEFFRDILGEELEDEKQI